MLMPFKNDDQLPGRSAPGGYRRCWDCGSRPLVLGLYLACRAQVSPGAMARAWCVWVWEMDLDEWMTLGDIGIYSHLTGIFIFIYGIYGIVGISKHYFPDLNIVGFYLFRKELDAFILYVLSYDIH